MMLLNIIYMRFKLNFINSILLYSLKIYSIILTAAFVRDTSKAIFILYVLPLNNKNCTKWFFLGYSQLSWMTYWTIIIFIGYADYFSNDREYCSRWNKIEIWIMQIQTGSALCKYSQDVYYANSYYVNVLGRTFISTFLREHSLHEFTLYIAQHRGIIYQMFGRIKLQQAFTGVNALRVTHCKIAPRGRTARLNSV